MSAIAPSPARTIRKDNPLCGDEIELTIASDGERISSATFRARACSLVTASAKVLATVSPGLTAGEARALIASVERAILQGAELPPGFESVRPVLLMPARRACALLPWRALSEALEGGL